MHKESFEAKFSKQNIELYVLLILILLYLGIHNTCIMKVLKQNFQLGKF